MGQAFRRASGRNPVLGSSTPLAKPPSGSTVTIEKGTITKSTTSSNNTQYANPDEAETGTEPYVNMDNVLEERNLQYDAMLNQMVGRIREKPPEKLVMGEGSMVKRSTRPMPKLRNTKPDSSSYEDTPTPPGTLNLAQLRQIMQLLKGKNNGHMDVHQISEQFRIEESQVKKILESISLPPEDSDRNKGPVNSP